MLDESDCVHMMNIIHMKHVWPQCFIKNQPSNQNEHGKEKRKRNTFWNRERGKTKTNRKGVIGCLLCVIIKAKQKDGD